MNRDRVMLWVLASAMVAYLALPAARAANPSPGAVCDKFTPAMGALPKDKIEEFITTQAAAGRPRIESISSGTSGQILMCAW